MKDTHYKIWSESVQCFLSYEVTAWKSPWKPLELWKKHVGHKICILCFSSPFIWNIFDFDKYLVSYTRDRFRACRLSCKAAYCCLILTKSGMCQNNIVKLPVSNFMEIVQRFLSCYSRHLDVTHSLA